MNRFHNQNEISRSYSFNNSKKYNNKRNQNNILNILLSILINIL